MPGQRTRPYFGHPHDRLATVDDVAAAIHFLAFDDAAMVNGHALCIDGGLGAGLSVSMIEAAIGETIRDGSAMIEGLRGATGHRPRPWPDTQQPWVQLGRTVASSSVQRVADVCAIPDPAAAQSPRRCWCCNSTCKFPRRSVGLLPRRIGHSGNRIHVQRQQ